MSDAGREYWTDGIGIVTKDEDYAREHNAEEPSHPFFKVIEKSAYEQLKKENEELRKFKEAWGLKDGNSPGYNLQKANNYGEQAARLKSENTQLKSMCEKMAEAIQNYCTANRVTDDIEFYEGSNEDQFLKALAEFDRMKKGDGK
jgi:hypothetical protein